jgi:hypothetical protein
MIRVVDGVSDLRMSLSCVCDVCKRSGHVMCVSGVGFPEVRLITISLAVNRVMIINIPRHRARTDKDAPAPPVDASPMTTPTNTSLAPTPADPTSHAAPSISGTNEN